jgi:hypothetical protein
MKRPTIYDKVEKETQKGSMKGIGVDRNAVKLDITSALRLVLGAGTEAIVNLRR